MANYFGLVEALMTFGGVTAFVIWQMRSLKRDVALREAREKAEAEAEAKTGAEAAEAPFVNS